MNNSILVIFGGGFICIISILVYFFPSIVAKMRDHNNKLSIFMTNIFLGWTFLGWVACIIWACSDNTKK